MWTVPLQIPLSMGFSRQQYWNGWPCPPPGDLPDPGIKPTFLTSAALASGFFSTSTTWEALPSVQLSSFQSLSRVRLFATPWTAALHALLCMEFSRREYWSGWPCPPPGDLANLGIKSRFPTLQAESLPSKPPGNPTIVNTLS